MSTLLLLGAGASFGSQYDNAPPLGIDLFDKLRSINPDGWGKVSEDLATVFRTDFEAGMEKLFETEEMFVTVLQKALAYFLHSFSPTWDSLYYRLARRIKRNSWNGSVATLNYDLLLQRSLTGAGIDWHIGEGRGNESLEICVPHGSCNLFVDKVWARGGTGFTASINGPIVLENDAMKFTSRLITNFVPPVMCYYEPTKRATAGSDFILEQRKRLTSLIGSASRIAVVGVKVHPSDRHIWDALSNANGTILYCGGPSGRLEYERWTDTNRPHRGDLAADGYFDDEFNAICRYLSV